MIFATHVPLAPGFAQYCVALSHWESSVHDVRQEVASLQMKPPAHAVGRPAMQPPAELQLLTVSIPAAHDVPHVAVDVGYMQAPPAAEQSVAPHVPPVTQAAAQQCVPVPVAPQLPRRHWSFAEQVAPAPPLTTHAPFEQ